MCSIFGFIKFGGKPDENIEQQINHKLRELALKAEGRGRDSWGLYLVNHSGNFLFHKGIGKISMAKDLFGQDLDLSDVSIIIANTRAEPTTDYIRHKTLLDIQPFNSERFIVAHNGAIANDEELKHLYSIEPESEIDSAILPPFFEINGVDDAIPQLKGSYALAVCTLDKPYELHLIRNYKPIAYLFDPSVNGLWYASEAAWLQASDLLYKPDIVHPIVPPPYSHIRINGKEAEVSIKSIDEKEKVEKHRIIVLASGGLDSTVVAALLKNQGHDVHLLHISYGCLASKQEEQAVIRISEFLDVGLTIVSNEWLKKIGKSSLTTTNSTIAEGKSGAKYPHEWVPARNMLFISLACAFADAEAFDAIAIGSNLEEGGTYSDNTEEFIRDMDIASKLGTSSRVKIISPIGNLMKHEIVKLGIEINAPIDLTWSCYKNTVSHCGNCGPCFMRKNAFIIGNYDDPIQYCNSNSSKRD